MGLPEEIATYPVPIMRCSTSADVLLAFE